MEKTIKIYYTSDIHSYFFPTNYLSSEKSNMGLFSVCSQFEKGENTLIIDGGDMLQGSPFASFVNKNTEHTKVFSDAMNDVGYDVVSLGNHDFNFGYDRLKEYANGLNADVLSCNVVDKRGELNLSPYVIKTMENGLKIGIVGAVTDYVNVWEDKDHLTEITVNDTFSSIEKTFREIKDKCDVTVLVYHGGFESNLERLDEVDSGSENVGVKICRELNYDLVLTGHQHNEIKGRKLYNSYTLQLPANCTNCAEINIEKAKNNITISSKTIMANANSKVDFDMSKYDKIQKNVEKWLDTPVGELSESMLETDVLTLMKNGWRFADFCNNAILEATKADFACCSLMNVPYPLNKTVSIRDIVCCYPFVNTISTIRITGKILKEALEQVATYFSLENHVLSVNKKYTETKLELYNYDFYYGFDYTFDVSKTIGNRVVNLSKNGKELDLSKEYVVAMSNYRSTGTGGYDMFKECIEKVQYPIEIQELLIEKISKKDIARIPEKGNFLVIT